VKLQNGTCTTAVTGARFKGLLLVVLFATLRLQQAEAEDSPRNTVLCDEVRVTRCFPLYRRFTGIRCSIQSKSKRGAPVYGAAKHHQLLSSGFDKKEIRGTSARYRSVARRRAREF